MQEEFFIDFKAIFKILWRNKLKCIVVSFLVGIIGGIFTFFVREEFISSGKILPEFQGKGAGSFSQFAGLASLAGIDLGSLGNSTIDAVRPDLYPDVLKSTEFYLHLLEANIETKENQKFIFSEYYNAIVEDGELSDSAQLLRYPVVDSSIIIVNKVTAKRIKSLRNRITSNIDKKTGIITVEVKMPDPIVAAQICRFALEYVMQYVKKYRTEKLQSDVKYLEEQVSISRGRYYNLQNNRAKYSDEFRDMALNSADLRRERIESDYKLSSSFYNELLKKYEEAKFKLHQETPVFKILEIPVAPVKRSEPKRGITVVVFFILGYILSIIYVIAKKENYLQIIKQVHSND